MKSRYIRTFFLGALTVVLLSVVSGCRYKDAIDALTKSGTTSSGIGTGDDINVTGTWRVTSHVTDSTSGRIIGGSGTIVLVQSGTEVTCTSVKRDTIGGGAVYCDDTGGCALSGVVVGNSLSGTTDTSVGHSTTVLTGESHKLSGTSQSVYTGGYCAGEVVRGTLVLSRTSTSTASVAAFFKKLLLTPLGFISEAVAGSRQGVGFFAKS